jgi:hypothetical protein
VPIRNGIDGHEIGDAVQHQHEHHGAGELDVERLGQGGKTLPESILDDTPSVEGRPRRGQGQTEHDRRKAKLLEPENGRDQPNRGREHPEHNGAPRRTVGAYRIGQVPPQQPCRYVRHADADEVGEVGGGDHPDRVTH